jgi:hypothetical protein
MEVVELVIKFNPSTGQVGISGPIDSPFICAGALMEALRIIQRRADAKDNARKNGKQIVVAPADVLD